MDNNEIKKANRKALPKFILSNGSQLNYRWRVWVLRCKIRTEHAGGRYEKYRSFFRNLYCPLADVGDSGYRADDLRSDL